MAFYPSRIQWVVIWGISLTALWVWIEGAPVRAANDRRVIALFVIGGLLLWMFSDTSRLLSKRSVTLINPQSTEVKTVKVGWSWTCFFFGSLFGIPLFMRGLTNWGFAMATIALLELSTRRAVEWIGFDLLLSDDIQPLGSALVLLVFLPWVAAVALSIFLGIKANEMTAKHYLRQGWVFANPDGAMTRLARAKWHLAAATTVQTSPLGGEGGEGTGQEKG